MQGGDKKDPYIMHGFCLGIQGSEQGFAKTA